MCKIISVVLFEFFYAKINNGNEWLQSWWTHISKIIIESKIDWWYKNHEKISGKSCIKHVAQTVK
jgi:hypothetical protein